VSCVSDGDKYKTVLPKLVNAVYLVLVKFDFRLLSSLSIHTFSEQASWLCLILPFLPWAVLTYRFSSKLTSITEPVTEVGTLRGPTKQVSLPSAEEANRSIFRNVVFSSYLEFQRLDKVRKLADSEKKVYSLCHEDQKSRRLELLDLMTITRSLI
jgi:hypothetical protein